MSIFLRHRGRHRAARRGQALVEFALVIPIFLLVLVALFDLGRAVFAYNTLTNAAREGARMAIVNQHVPTITKRAKEQTAIVELMIPDHRRLLPAGRRRDADLSDPCVPAAVGCLAVVSFQATYQPITPLVSNILFKSGSRSPRSRC
jgi:hypothetical protein